MSNYANKLILAPMVRISTLPMRLLALDYGADIVYSEEIIDHKMLQCQVVKNDLLDTTDFTMADGTIVFRTCPREKKSLVFQVGSSDENRAVEVANMVKDYVTCFDVNMGCPKEFSIKGGMGVALMYNSEKAKAILTALVKSINLPISCKIRIFETAEKTIDFVRSMELCGVSHIAIHGRMKDERPQHQNHDDIIASVASTLNIPVIANGGSNRISSYADIEKFRASTGCSSVMLARTAQWNPSIFSNLGLQPIDDVIKKYLRYCVDYDSHLSNVKYVVQQFLHEDLKSETGQKLLTAKSLREICCIWQMESYYDEACIRFEAKKNSISSNKTIQIISESVLENNYEITFKYNRRDFEGSKSPKMVLYEWATKLKLLPHYEIINNSETRLFRSILTLEGNKYASLTWDKSKKNAEQASACVCLTILNNEYEDSSRNNKPTYLIPPPTIPYRKSEQQNSNKMLKATEL